MGDNETIDDLLSDARIAENNKNYEKASKSYKRLMELYTNKKDFSSALDLLPSVIKYCSKKESEDLYEKFSEILKRKKLPDIIPPFYWVVCSLEAKEINNLEVTMMLYEKITEECSAKNYDALGIIIAIEGIKISNSNKFNPEYFVNKLKEFNAIKEIKEIDYGKVWEELNHYIKKTKLSKGIKREIECANNKILGISIHNERNDKIKKIVDKDLLLKLKDKWIKID
ncbi:hypothetical protein JW949_00085 [Candidatus Woesearchaeota archaeon]|nr:hypothetical protein [Candidatus Woesearchaeota archaeon]